MMELKWESFLWMERKDMTHEIYKGFSHTKKKSKSPITYQESVG